jgi:hypothetical protein
MVLRCSMHERTPSPHALDRPEHPAVAVRFVDPFCRVRKRDRVIVASFLAFVSAASGYRAATQAIVYDEATTYLMFLAGPLERVFTWYTANNHVLFTLAAKASTAALGVSEVTLRLPSVLAGIGYLIGSALLARRVSSSRLVFVLTLCALTLNPLVFDFMAAARGYGLALCLFALALLELSREPGRQRWWLASLALGGSVSANLAFAFPALALLTTASAIAVKRAAGWRGLVARGWLPGMLVAAALLVVPLQNATLDTFFFGAESLIETARSIVRLSVAHHPTWWTGTSIAAWTEALILVAVVLTVIAAASAALIRLVFPAPSGPPALALLGGTLAFTIALLLVAHVAAGVLYPKGRTGLYFVPLVVLTLAALTTATRHKIVRWSAVSVLCLLTVTALEQFTTASFGPWRYDAGSRRIAELIAARASVYGRSVRVAATEHLYQPALEFYRVTKYPNRFAPVLDGLDSVGANGSDIVVVPVGHVAQAGCRQVYVDAVSGAEVRECIEQPPASDPRAVATTGSRGAQ